MTIMEKVLALYEVELFEDMATEELSMLASIAEEESYDAGESLFDENEATDSLNLLISGKVQILRGDQEIFVAGSHDALGTLSMLDGRPWLFTAKVIEPAHVLRIDRETFLDLIADHPGIIEALLRSLVSRVRKLVDSPLAGRKSSEQSSGA